MNDVDHGQLKTQKYGRCPPENTAVRIKTVTNRGIGNTRFLPISFSQVKENKWPLYFSGARRKRLGRCNYFCKLTKGNLIMTQPERQSSRNSLLHRYPISAFVLLTFLTTHIVNPVVVEIVQILFPSFSFSFPLSGLNERSVIAQYGGTLIAVYLVVKLYGVAGFKSTLQNSMLKQDSVKYLLISFMMPLSMILISYYLAGVHLDKLQDILAQNWQLYLLVIGGFILSAGLAEEYGWRGFLLPQLLKSKSPTMATLITFTVVSLWHFPALLAGWKEESLLPWLLLSVPVAIIHSWLFFKSRGNLIVVILFHACFDAQYSFFNHFIPSSVMPHHPFHQGWVFIALNCLAGFVIIVATRGTLGFNPKEFSISAYFGNAKQADAFAQ
jgi:membrane protease YdiL (CAAX protease family)